MNLLGPLTSWYSCSVLSVLKKGFSCHPCSYGCSSHAQPLLFPSSLFSSFLFKMSSSLKCQLLNVQWIFSEVLCLKEWFWPSLAELSHGEKNTSQLGLILFEWAWNILFISAKFPTLLCYWMQWFIMIAVWPLPMLDPLILADHTWVPLIVYSLTIFPSPLSSIFFSSHSQVHIFLLLWIVFSRTCYTYVMIVVLCVWTFPLFIMILRFLHNVYVCIWGRGWIEIHWVITQCVFSLVDRHLGCF